jgi:hypothetical protein
MYGQGLALQMHSVSFENVEALRRFMRRDESGFDLRQVVPELDFRQPRLSFHNDTLWFI